MTIPSPPPANASSSPSAPSQTAGSSSPARSLRITVPFSPQAPYAVWDALHEEACEEMSLIMAAAYWKEEPLSRREAEDALQKLIRWEEERGFGADITAAQTTAIARDYFGLDATVRADVTADSIREELRRGRPVIVPAAGRDLGNPYFSGEGPWYHMLVITGYAAGTFITNDPGTRRGEGYAYDEDVLLGAIRDWNGRKEEIRSGEKAMVILGE